MMERTICWVHIGDLHLDEQEKNWDDDTTPDPWGSFHLCRTIVGKLAAAAGKGIDFVYLPGDNANHGKTIQYDAMIDALAPLDAVKLPWRVIPGDHDFEPGDLAAYDAKVPAGNRPDCDAGLVPGYRCIFLDIVSAGAGGPDFRLTMHDRNRIGEELARAEAAGETPLVFMHAYPGDLAADGDAVARAFADGRVAFVDTGHTHYNELLNDGRVIYGATRSTGQIEEGGGIPGYSIVCVHGRVPSWRFRTIDQDWPHVQIVSPCDLRLVTRPADPHQVPRPGQVPIVARTIGAAAGARVSVHVDDDAPVEMTRDGDDWTATVTINEPGLRTVTVVCGTAQDRIDLLVRPSTMIPKRRLPVALGQECHAIGAWVQAGISGTQLGPNKNGHG